eukprot:1474126-Rhodomonas_salina.1
MSLAVSHSSSATLQIVRRRGQDPLDPLPGLHRAGNPAVRGAAAHVLCHLHRVLRLHPPCELHKRFVGACVVPPVLWLEGQINLGKKRKPTRTSRPQQADGTPGGGARVAAAVEGGEESDQEGGEEKAERRGWGGSLGAALLSPSSVLPHASQSCTVSMLSVSLRSSFSRVLGQLDCAGRGWSREDRARLVRGWTPRALL